MDATKLIEEAERLSAKATPGPWRHVPGVLYKHYVESEDDELHVAIHALHHSDGHRVPAMENALFIAYARALVPDLAAALKASEERARKAEAMYRQRDADVTAWQRTATDLYTGNPPSEPSMAAGLKLMQEHMRQRDQAKAWIQKAEQDRDALAAANLAANKRIVELEQQQDDLAARLHSAQGAVASLRDERAEAVRTGLSAAAVGFELTKERDMIAKTARETIETLLAERDAARAELARLTTPRPIAEAPRKSGSQIIALWMDGDVVESLDVVCWADMDDGEHPERKFWINTAGDVVEHMTHYLPLPEVMP